jgi:hypothetical protein
VALGSQVYTKGAGPKAASWVLQVGIVVGPPPSPVGAGPGAGGAAGPAAPAAAPGAAARVLAMGDAAQEAVGSGLRAALSKGGLRRRPDAFDRPLQRLEIRALPRGFRFARRHASSCRLTRSGRACCVCGTCMRHAAAQHPQPHACGLRSSPGSLHDILHPPMQASGPATA